jgi:AmmeMemoRadiSam system protein B
MAGTFYPAEPEQCRLQARSLVAAEQTSGLAQTFGAIVPHAGWICSGAIAGLAIATIAKSRPDAHVVIVFGAVHTPAPLGVAALDSHRAWEEPGAVTAVAGELRGELAAQSRWFAVNDFFHQREHAVEVVLPLVQAAWPKARVLPVETPPVAEAAEFGRITAKAAIAAGLQPVYLASSDLTHYGPAYHFTPAGVGEAGLRGAVENDRRLLEIVTTMTPQRIVPEVAARRNACGAGAIAAMMAACLEHGARSALVLRQTSSFSVLSALAPQRPDNAVGYAAVVLG